MSRLFLMLAIALVVYLLIRSYRKNVPQQDKTVTEDMVRCEHCGVHLPKGESILAGGNFFCCAEHRDAFKK
jgi:uncharacterized protein